MLIIRITLLLLFFKLNLISQELRGIKPTKSGNSFKTATSRALVIGISNYKDSLITDLRYAHRDAAEFAKFLHSKNGFSLRAENIVLLTNEMATGGRVNNALNWLLEMTDEGDEVVIYFAGHGDVESKLISSPGYLLLYDSPQRSYFINSISVGLLQNIVETISAKNKARVILVSDACHAGNLAGNSIKGSGITTQNLMDIFRNQVLILSCQPEEVSLEGMQWGQGRGLFSYHFINALNGYANTDHDSVILLKELERYVQDKVSHDALKLNHQQTPIVRGNVNQSISYLDPGKANQNSYKSDYGVSTLNSIGSRSVVAMDIREEDTVIQRLYSEFQGALNRKELTHASSGNQTADSLFEQLKSKLQGGEFLKSIINSYAAALTDEANGELINILNETDQTLYWSKKKRLQQVKLNIINISKAIQILGENHYFTKYLQARKFLFEGIELYLSNSNIKSLIEGQEIMTKLNNSLSLEQNSPLTYFYMMLTQATKLRNRDSSIYYCEKAVENSVGWITPYCFLSSYLCEYFNDSTMAKEYAAKIESINPQSTLLLNLKGLLAFYDKNYMESGRVYSELIKLQPDNIFHYQNLGINYYKQNKLDSSEFWFLRGLSVDSGSSTLYYYLGLIAYDRKNFDLTIHYCKKALSIYKNSINTLRLLGIAFLDKSELLESKECFERILAIQIDEKTSYYYLSLISIRMNKKEDCLRYLEFAFKYGYNNIKNIHSAKEFEAFKQDKDFIDLLTKYKLN